MSNPATWDWNYLGVMAALLALFSGILLWAVRTLLKRQADDVSSKLLDLMKRDTTQDDDIDAVRKELNDHRVDVATNYIRREDALVFFSRFEQKIDAVWQAINERYKRGS